MTLPSVTSVTSNSTKLAKMARSSMTLPKPEPEMVAVVGPLMLSGEMLPAVGETEEYRKEQLEWQELGILPIWKMTSPRCG